ncbi:uncharacterized protein H6S33_005606 [Morchella sextelata]|uniref:uncharacterized protein n=1 Tax=Morchella sextelata TaxID=1174677 RepID=UPI001D036DF1|nr:uncharacterized protein H6S33_005606 [Morchella sextelata]KAH0613720.1 hypothetical protein H6S33_005606 [Morchella sextelata]
MFTNYSSLVAFLGIICLLLNLTFTTAAEVGYGPKFDACGDNCQTQMVSFCTVGHDQAQMRACWCEEAQYIIRMDACLRTCDPAVSNIDEQRDQLLRYRNFVCEPSTASADTEFTEYYQTRFASVEGGFVPEITRGIPPPTASPRDIQTTTTETMASTSTPLGSDTYTNLLPSSTLTTIVRPTSNITTSPVSTATATASSYVTALPSTAAGPTMLKTGLTTVQLALIISGVALFSIILSISILYYTRRREPPKRPIWNPPPPPPLPRPSPTSFIYYHPTSPPPIFLSPSRKSFDLDLQPHAITTSTSSFYSRDSESVISPPSRGRGRYTYFPPRESPMPSPELSDFNRYFQPPPQPPPPPPSSSYFSVTPLTTPAVPASSPAPSVSQITSASAIAAAIAANHRKSRNSSHTLIDAEPQQAVVQGAVGRNTSRSRSRGGFDTRRSSRRRDTGIESECCYGYECEEDDCNASCESWSERGSCYWYEEDANWWDLRESQVMGPVLGAMDS